MFIFQLIIIHSFYAGTNFSVHLNVTYDSDMAVDFRDLRFVNGSDNTQLGYWINLSARMMKYLGLLELF